MSFIYPLGLLGLIGLPILVIIYIIKSKYTEQTVSSTYLWTLSEKFLKRRNPLSKLSGIISLILQILAVILISLAIAHPIIAVPNSANEYCFILDASGSMNMSKDGETRFERGKREISDIIEESSDGSLYSLVLVGNETRVIFEKSEDKEEALTLLGGLESAYNSADLTEALGIAQGYFNENPSLITYLVSDKEHSASNNINVINLSRGESNHALSDVIYTHENSLLEFEGSLISYDKDALLDVELFINSSDTAIAKETVSVVADEKTPFTISANVEIFTEAKIRITSADDFAYDNEYIVYDLKSEGSYNTLIISERPFLIKAMLSNILHAKIDVIKPSQYNGQSGYGLYIFDSVEESLISELPKDGSVWLMNIQGSVNGAGYSVQGAVDFEGSETLSLSTSTSSLSKALAKDLPGEGIHITRYVKCGFYRNFTNIFTYKGNPIVFAGSTTDGVREVVFAFDIHDSNLPLLSDYAILMRNLVNYSFPDVVEKTSYKNAESAEINVVSNCESIRVESPLGNVSYLSTSAPSASLPLSEVGVYKVTMTVAGSAKSFSIFSEMSEAERDPSVSEGEISLVGEASDKGFDGKYDPLPVIFIILAIIFLADWMVYCYDKYQFR